MNFRNHIFVSATLLLLPTLTATQLHAGNNTNVVMKALSGDIVKYLVNNSQKQVAVDSFDAPSNAGVNLQIERRLREQLSADENIELVNESEIVRPDCWSIRGSYSVRSRGEESFAEITARIYDDDNVEQHSFVPFPFKIDDVSDLTVIAAATFDASATSNQEGKRVYVTKALSRAIEEPSVSISLNGRVSATQQSPYAMELLVCNSNNSPVRKQDYVADPRRVQKREFKLKDGTRGFAVADLLPGELYAIRLYNDSDYDSAVKLCIDGLSTFEFTQVPSYRRTDVWIVPRHSSGTIYGWHRTNHYSDSFEIAHLPETAIGKSGRSTAKAGTIQAIFYQAWSQDDVLPPGELVSGGAGFDVVATKQGAEIQTSYAETRRFFSMTPISSICVRYAKPVDDLPPPITGL